MPRLTAGSVACRQFAQFGAWSPCKACEVALRTVNVNFESKRRHVGTTTVLDTGRPAVTVALQRMPGIACMRPALAARPPIHRPPACQALPHGKI